MPDNKKLMESFYAALEAHDWDGARRLLRDDFRFLGPNQQSESADEFIAVNRQINPDWKFRNVKMLVQADTIASFFTTVMTSPATGTNRCAEWVEVADGKLQSIELVYNPAGFR